MIFSARLLHVDHEFTGDYIEKCLLSILMQIVLTVGETQLGKKRLDWEKVAYRPLFMLTNTLMSCIKCTAASHPASCPRHSCNIPTACYSLKHSSNIDWCRPGFLSRGTSLLAINVSSDVALFGNSILLM